MKQLVPTNNTPIVIADKTSKTIYADSFDFSQKDVGYKLPAPNLGADPAPKDITIYANTLNVKSNIVMPGRSLTIVAKTLNLENDFTLIDVAGPQPKKSFKMGNLPANSSDNGKNGTNGINAGNIAISADKVNYSGGKIPTPGVVNIGDDIQQAIDKAFKKIHGKIPQKIKIGKTSIPISGEDGEYKGTFDFYDMVFENFNTIGVTSCYYNPHYNEVHLTLSSRDITFGGLFVYEQTYPEKLHSKPTFFAVTEFSVVFDIRFKVDPQTYQAKEVKTLLYLTEPFLQFKIVGIDPWINLFLEILVNAPFAIFWETIKKIIADEMNSHVEDLQTIYNEYIGESVKVKPGLMLCAQGGVGGRGQDGANGAYSEYGKGGNAGNAGTSGNGGNGGQIALNRCISSDIVVGMNNLAGSGGGMAIPGQPGIGKPFGAKATFNGNDGKLGTSKKDMINGTALKTGVNTFPAFDRNDLAPFFNADILSFIQRTANFTFLNAKKQSDYSTAVDLYIFLSQINERYVGISAPSKEESVRVQQRSSANVMLTRISRGLDYFGNAYNYVPKLSAEYIGSNMQATIDLTKIIEDQYDAYMKESATISQKITALKGALSKVQGRIGDKKTSGSLVYELDVTIPKRIANTKKVLDSLTKQVNDQFGKITAYEDDLNKAIKLKFGIECAKLGLKSVFTILKTIVPIAAGDPLPAIEQLTSIGKGLAGDGADYAGQAYNNINQFIKSEAIVDDIRKSFGTLKKEITAKDPDGGKMILLEQKFQIMLKPFLNEISSIGADARKLLLAIDTLIYLAKCRNEKVILYNALYMELGHLKARIQQQEAESNRIRSIIAENSEKDVPSAYINYLENTLNWAYSYLLKELYREYRAFEFFAAEYKTKPTLSKLNVAKIASAQLKILTEKEHFYNTLPNPPQKISPIIEISDKDFPHAFLNLKDNGEINFTIPMDYGDFDGLTLVKISTFTLVFPALETIGTGLLKVDVIFSGNYQLRPPLQTKKHVTFTSEHRDSLYEYDYKNKRIVIQPALKSKEYAAPSPFTNWTMKLSSKDPKLQAAIKDIKSFKISFEGTAYGAGKESIDKYLFFVDGLD